MKAPITPTASAMRAPLSAAGQRRRQLGEAEGLPARGVERAQQLELVGIDGGEPVDGRDDDREEADQHDHDSLGSMPKPHQNTSSGAITAIGTACEPTASG